MRVKGELRGELATLKVQLQRMATEARTGGEANALRSRIVELEAYVAHLELGVSKQKQYRASTQTELGKAEGERLELEEKSTTLLAEVSLLRGRVAEYERAAQRREEEAAVRARYDARAVAREQSRARWEAARAERGAEAEVAKARAEVAEATAAAEASVSEAQATASREIVNTQARAQAEADARVADADARVAAAEARAKSAEAWAEEAAEDADRARGELMDEQKACREAAAEKTAAEWELWDAERRAKRAKEKAERLQGQVDQLAGPTKERSADAWAALTAEARRKAAERERDHLQAFFSSHAWRVDDISDALKLLGLVAPLLETRPFFDLYFEKTKALMTKLEKEEFGITFGLYLHYEARLTFPKILSVSQAAAKKYDHHLDRYRPKVLLGHKYLKGVGINVPRVAPPISILEPKVKAIHECLGIEHSEDGMMAYVPFDAIMQQVLTRDPGRGDMPPLPFFLGGHQPLPLVISWDATGYGTQQFNTIALRNPYMSAAAQQLHTFGLGNCDDGREGTTRLLGPNLARINELISLKRGLNQKARCVDVPMGDDSTVATIAPDIKIVTDVSALRHNEHLACSGWCGCSRDFALRFVPKKPNNQAELTELCQRLRVPHLRGSRHQVALAAQGRHHPAVPVLLVWPRRDNG